MNSINISGVSGGEIIGVGTSGTGNVVGREVRIAGGVQVSTGQLAGVPNELAEALKAFSASLNGELQAAQVPPEAVAPVQATVDALAEEVADVTPGEPVSGLKKRSIGTALAAVADGLLKVLPNAARTLAAMTPLAPFGALIGEGLDAIVASVSGSQG